MGTVTAPGFPGFSPAARADALAAITLALVALLAACGVAHTHQPAGRHHTPAHVERPRRRPLRTFQPRMRPKGLLPYDLADVQVDGRECPPGRRVDGKALRVRDRLVPGNGVRKRGVGVGFDHPHHLGHVARVDVQDAGFRIDRGTSPVGATVELRVYDVPTKARWVVKFGFAVALKHSLAHKPTGLRRAVRDVGLFESLPCVGRRARGNRLRRPGLFPGHVRLRHRSLLHLEQGLAGLTIEQEEIAHLGDLCHSVDATAVVVDGYEVGWGRKVVVPEVMVDDLVVPDALPSGSVEGDHGVRKQVLPVTVRPEAGPSTISISGGGHMAPSATGG